MVTVLLPHCACGEDDPAEGRVRWEGCVPRRQVREGPVCLLKCPRFTETILCNPREFSRPEYWSGQPFPSPGDLPNPGIKPGSPALQADSFLSVYFLATSFRTLGRIPSCPGIVPTLAVNLPSTCRQILHQLSHREAQEHCSGYPIPSPADLPDPGIEPRSPALQADSLPTDPSGKPRTETTETTYPTSLLENQRRKADSLLLVRDLDSLICVSLHRNHRSNFHSGIWRHPRHTCEERAQL